MERNFIESYCVKITEIPIHLINQIKDQSILALATATNKKNGIFSYLLLVKMDYTPRKLQTKLMKTLTQMYTLFLKAFRERRGGKEDYLKVCEIFFFLLRREEFAKMKEKTHFLPSAFHLEHN